MNMHTIWHYSHPQLAIPYYKAVSQCYVMSTSSNPLEAISKEAEAKGEAIPPETPAEGSDLSHPGLPCRCN